MSAPISSDTIKNIASYLDAKSLSSMLTINHQFHSVVSNVLERVQPHYVESATLLMPSSTNSLAVRIDTTALLQEDQHVAALLAQNPNDRLQLIRHVVRELAKRAFHRNEELYGAELLLNYKKDRYDKFVIMHPNTLELSKDWDEEWKPYPTWGGFEEDLLPGDRSLAMFPEEKIYIQKSANGNRTVFVFTPDSVKSAGSRLTSLINQDALKNFRIEKVCMSEALMSWLCKMKCRVSRISLLASMYTAPAPMLTDLLDMWQSSFIEILCFGFECKQNPFGPFFWNSKVILNASSINIRAHHDPNTFCLPLRRRGEQRSFAHNCTNLESYRHRFDVNHVNLTRMKCHTLFIHVAATSTEVNELLKAWMKGEREIRQFSLRGPQLREIDDPVEFELKDVLADIEHKVSYQRGPQHQYQIARENGDELWMQIGRCVEIRTHRFG